MHENVFAAFSFQLSAFYFRVRVYASIAHSCDNQRHNSGVGGNRPERVTCSCLPRLYSAGSKYQRSLISRARLVKERKIRMNEQLNQGNGSREVATLAGGCF